MSGLGASGSWAALGTGASPDPVARDPRRPRAGRPDLALRDVVDDLVAGAAVAVFVDTEPELLSRPCPAALADALTRALGEALRNVARHSGVAWARLEVLALPAAGAGGEGPASWVLTLVDGGAGFPTEVRPGFGLEESVRRPVEAVGGRLTLLPTPGGGATVRITVPAPAPHADRTGVWSDDGLARTYRQTVLTTGGSISLVRAVAWPQGVVWTYLAVKYSLQTPSPLPLLALTAALAALLVLVASRLEGGPPSRRWASVVAVVLVAAQVDGLRLLPPGAMLDYRSWTIGFVAVPVMVLCMFLPRRAALVVALPHPLLVLAVATLDPSLSGGRLPVGSLLASALTPLLGVVIGVLLRRSGAQVMAERDRLSRAERALARRRARAEVGSLHLDHTRHVVVPWLEQVGDGRVALSDPDTALRARTLSLEVRDDLYAPGLFDQALRRQVSSARARGAVVEVGAGFAPGAGDRTTGRLLRELAPHLHDGTKLTVVTREGRTRLALVPSDPVLVQRARDLVGESLALDVDEFRAVLHYVDAPGAPGIRGVVPPAATP